MTAFLNVLGLNDSCWAVWKVLDLKPRVDVLGSVPR